MHQFVDPSPTTIHLPIHGGRKGRFLRVRAHATVLNDEFTHNVLMKLRWSLANKYPEALINGKQVKLHLLVYNNYFGSVKRGCEVDHKNRNKLDATPGNLRSVTHSVNIANTGLRETNRSGYHGVSYRLRVVRKTGWCKAYWVAVVVCRGRYEVQKLFPFTPQGKIDAALAVNEAYRKWFPEVDLPNPEVEKLRPVSSSGQQAQLA